MDTDIVIRPYQVCDRSVVRRICLDTADRGQPLPLGGLDGELVADLVTRYYTDIDPRWSWRAEERGQVIGYVMTALDTRAFRRAMAWRIVPGAVSRAVGRGLLFSPAFWKMAQVFVRRRGRNITPHFPIPARYPAHLHINLLDGYRGRGVGERLITATAGQLAAQKISGVHATVRADNPGACRFFERMDFTAIDHYNVVLPCGGGTQDVGVTVYGRLLVA